MTERSTEWAREALGVSLTDGDLLLRALTHKSVGPDNYERLEFLGDRILGAVIADWLYADFPKEPEGKLTRRFHQLVSRDSCARIARQVGVPSVVRLGQQARADGGADSENILGDVMEALLGAVYLEQGMDSARGVIRRLWAAEVSSATEAPKHPKMQLQEWAAANNLKSPVYRLLGRSGPHHSPRFRVALAISDLPSVEAEGTSKQEAETLAARAFLEAHAV
ncbi:ribonuclease III [Sandaracinobacteroides hominis]|uniref:ribonuclease III n=1 Tax=Sandaracinobacteroides hominis TaxID=2780086 RepID=UPI0018F401F6|nr:ribonuclease III [Sandaracinobacteroides hominis]